MLTRRNFLQTAALATASSAMLTLPELTLAKQIKTVGIQLYTVREQMAKDFEGTLKAVAALGYKEFEFAGYGNKDPKQVRTFIDGLGVTAPSAHVALPLLDKEINKAIDSAKIMGHKLIICPFLQPNERKLDDYKKAFAILNKAGEACKKAGLQLGYHNHDFEFKAVDGKIPMALSR